MTMTRWFLCTLKVFREGRTKAVGNITKLIPMMSSTTTHGPKIKPIKNAPKHHQHNQHNQGGHHQQSSHDAGGTAGVGHSQQAAGNNENAAPGVHHTNGGAADSTENSQKPGDEPRLASATHLTDLTTVQSTGQGGQGQQKRNRNKRGGRGKHHGGGGQNTEGSSVGHGSSVVPLGEANI
jgi:hypothetical protein